jgi:hypothetical protein
MASFINVNEPLIMPERLTAASVAIMIPIG